MYDAVTSGDSAGIGNSLVSSIASIPSLMETLLLLNNNYPVESRVFHLSIVGRIISSKHTIGNCFVHIREAVDPTIAHRGVNFVKILSEDKEALIPSTRQLQFAETQLTPAARAALYYKAYQLNYSLPVTLALEETSDIRDG